MTTEELKVKVSLDTSGLKQDINKVKKSLNDLDSQTNKAMTGSSKGAGLTQNHLIELRGTLESVAQLQFWDLIIDNFDKAAGATKKFASAVKKNVVGGLAQAKSSLAWIAGVDLSDMIGNIQNGFEALAPWRTKNEEFTGKGFGAAMSHFKQAFGGDLTTLLKNAGMAVKSLGAAFIGLGAAVGSILAVVAAITGLAGALAALARARDNAQAAWNAEKIGMTADAYGEWGYVITQLGGEIDDLTDYVRTLSAAQNEVRAGSEDLTAAFARLGMSQEEVSNMSQSEMFARTIMGLQNLENEVERVSLAYKIFGEDDGAKVTTLLNSNNAEIERMIHNYHMLGGVMSGDLINNSKILTGSLNNLKQAWIGLKNTLAEVFLPIVIPVVQWLVRAVAVVNMFIRAIFGKDIVVASSGITDVANAYTGYTDSANEATNATNKVTEAVERLKRVTMGFDELNKLPGVDKTSSNTGDTGNSGVSQLPSGGSVGGLDIPTTEDLGLDGIAEWFETNQSKLQFWSGLLLTLGGIALAAFCFLSGNIAGGIAGLALASIGIAVGSQDGGTWDQLADGIKGVWANIKTWFSEHVAPVFTKKWWSDKWSSFKEGAEDAWEKFKSSPVGQFFAGLKDKAVTLTADFKEKASSVRTKLVETWDKVKTATRTLTANFVEKASKVKKTLISAWDKLKTKTAELKSKFVDGYSNTRKRLTDAWGKLKTVTRTLTAKFKESGARKTIASYWDKFKTKTSTLTVAFKDAFTSKIKAAWNGLVKAINSAISTINKIPKVNIPKLPYLATGGIVTGPTTAVIGEAGREAVLPLDNNTGWMDALADKIAARGGNNNAPTKIVLTVDGKQLGWATIDNINSITKQTGSLPLQLV